MTEKSFREKWLETVDRKGSVLCAGLDPADFEMGRGDEGLPDIVDLPPGSRYKGSFSYVFKRDWALNYIEAVAPFCAAIKPNINYWKGSEKVVRLLQPDEEGEYTEVRGLLSDMKALEEISEEARALGLVVIEDSKLTDIGSTNDAGMYYAAQKRMNAVTFVPFAGNLEEAVKQAHSRDLGLISMVLMSNPESEREKNKLVPVSQEEAEPFLYHYDDVFDVGTISYVKQYIQLAHDARKFGVDGIVVGAPSPKNHIKEEEIRSIRDYVREDMLVLLPGVGKQGGEAGIIWKYFGRDNVIVNVGRDLMFPNGSNSTPEQQAEKAKYYFDMLNKLRAA